MGSAEYRPQNGEKVIRYRLFVIRYSLLFENLNPDNHIKGTS